MSERRKKLGLTQVQLSKLSGVHVITISRIERGYEHKRGFLWETVARLAKALRIRQETLEALAMGKAINGKEMSAWKRSGRKNRRAAAG